MSFISDWTLYQYGKFHLKKSWDDFERITRNWNEIKMGAEQRKTFEWSPWIYENEIEREVS